jgi:hypothetical protein
MRIETTARALKVSLVLDPTTLSNVTIPDGTGRVVLAIRLPDRTVTADIAAKGVRRAVAAIAENGPDGVALVLSGRLDGGAIAEAGLSAMPKVAKAAPEGRIDTLAQRIDAAAAMQAVAQHKPSQKRCCFTDDAARVSRPLETYL